MQKKSDVLREQIVACQSSVNNFRTCCSSRATNNVYKRSLFYWDWAKLYQFHLTRGQKYEDLRPVIATNILYFNLFDDNRCNRHFIMKDEKTNEEYIRMIVLRSSKFLH